MESRQNNFAHDRRFATAESLASEIVHLAIATAQVVAANVAKQRLENRIEDLLDRNLDHVIELAIKIAPHQTIAQTIRNMAESVSVTVKICRDGNDIQISLFAVPVITSFGEGVPVSQFKIALQGLAASMELTKYVNGIHTGAGHVMLLPELFRLDELRALPLSALRQGTMALGRTSGIVGDTAHPFIKKFGSFKRSTEFLRYFVGRRVVTKTSVIGCRRNQTHTRIQTFTKQFLERRIGLQCTVDTFHSGSFHDSLYTGMWRYQEKRLDQVSQHTRNSASEKNLLEAKIVTHGHRDRFNIRLGFFANGKSIGGRSYLLGSRPGEDAGRCVERVIHKIEATGIRTSAKESFVPLEAGFSLGKKRRTELSMIAIPI